MSETPSETDVRNSIYYEGEKLISQFRELISFSCDNSLRSYARVFATIANRIIILLIGWYAVPTICIPSRRKLQRITPCSFTIVIPRF